MVRKKHTFKYTKPPVDDVNLLINLTDWSVQNAVLKQCGVFLGECEILLLSSFFGTIFIGETEQTSQYCLKFTCLLN